MNEELKIPRHVGIIMDGNGRWAKAQGKPRTAGHLAGSENIRKIAGADIGLSVTGAAGPDGSEGHNPGFVFIGLNNGNKPIVKQLDIEPKSRNFVREQAVLQLFELLINFLKED